MILLMVGSAMLLDEREIIFPEMAALTIGMWIVDKRVWRVSRCQLVVLMSLGAFVGVCIVRYSSFPLIVELSLAFAFAALCLFITGTTLIPLISACMLPVLLGTESWVYPTAVLVMSLIIIAGQVLMEKLGWRHNLQTVPQERNRRKSIVRWGWLLLSVSIIASLAIYSSNFYFIVPPLIVTYVEFVNSKAGFRNRPIQTILLLTAASVLGVLFQLVGYYYLHLPEVFVALCVMICLFILFECMGKLFAPAGALALIPMLLPPDTLIWLPLQVALGASLFIFTAMLFFQKCYQWPRAHLIFCLTSARIRKWLHK